MAGSPKKRARREAAAAELARASTQPEVEVEAEVEEHPQAKPGSPEWSEWMAEKRRQKRQEREAAEDRGLVPEPEAANETQEEKDERVALNILRKQMGVSDEKIAQVAAIKLLEHRRVGKRGEQDGDDPEAIVYETAFAPEAFDLLRELAKDEAQREVVPA